jgi:hypothetical protein
VHKALDQVGALAGPLVVAAVIAVTGAIWPAMLALAIPGAVALLLLMLIRHRVPDPAVLDPALLDAGPAPPTDTPLGPQGVVAAVVGADLPRRFFLFAFSAGATTAGLVTFGLIGYHLATEDLVPTAGVPVVYAVAMAAEALAALLTGFAYDRWQGRVLVCLPLLVTAVPALVFTDQLWIVVVGVLAWGAAAGVQDSTVKAFVADLVAAPRRATAYGVFAAIQGAAAVVGGGVAGALYTRSVPALVGVVALTQAVAAVQLVRSLRVRSA